MGFIRNFEIWNNQRPKVCSFDIDDYCTLWGAVGNTCTENTTAPDMTGDGDMFTTSNATHDAWAKAVVEYFTASINFYREADYEDPDTGEIIIPQTLNERCILRDEYNELCNLFYNQTNGFFMKDIAFQAKKMQIANSFKLNSDPGKRTGVHSFTQNIETAPHSPGIQYTYTVDFTDYQSPDYNHYLEYRTVLGDLMQLVKKLMTATADHPLTPFEIPPICSGDVVIGDQTWNQCNLSVTTYRNGDPIPHVEDPVAWAALTTGAWCYYDNNPDTQPAFGKLYNWYAINDPRGLTPEGYHVPTRYEWQTLIDTVGGNATAGIALKQIGSLDRSCVTEINASYWQKAPIEPPTNSSFFTALPGGLRTGTVNITSPFEDAGYLGYWWSSTEIDSANSSFMSLEYSTNEAYTTYSTGKLKGMSVRAVKDPTCADDVTIGSQVWTRCNLAVTTYRNGDSIPQVTNPTEWTSLTTGAWCYYNNDPLTEPLYGKLYNWYAVNDPRGLAIDGYHIPTDDEFAVLSYYLGGDLVAGGRMKQTGTAYWNTPNTDATNESGFTGLPGGRRNINGSYFYIGIYGYWWSSTEDSAFVAWSRYLDYNFGDAFRNLYFKRSGFSVRLVKGPAICTEVKIGYQTWSTCNLNVDRYSNGDIIPQVQDPTEWENLTTGAWCYYEDDALNGQVYGKLYNWYAVNDPRGLAPQGYKIPTYDEFVTLIDYLGGDTVAGGKLKEIGTTHWASPNTNATNSSGFTALGGGAIQFNGISVGKFTDCNLWSSTSYPYVLNSTWILNLNYQSQSATLYAGGNTLGFSVRLIKKHWFI